MGKKKVSKRWEKHKGFKKPFDYVLYPGTEDEQELTLRRLDMDDILELGVSNELDFMTKALMEGQKKPKDEKPDSEKSEEDKVKDIISQATNMAEMKKMVNAICVEGILDPEVHPVPRHENARQKGLLYVDEIPFEDRVELFSVIFDTEGLSTFREEQSAGVGNVANVTSVQLPPDRHMDVRPDNSQGVLLQPGSNEIWQNDRVGSGGSGEISAQESQGSGSGQDGEHSQTGSVGKTSGNLTETT